MSDSENLLIEGLVKYRDGKKWKSRWFIMKKMSPAADSVSLFLFKNYKDRRMRGETLYQVKESFLLKKILALEVGLTMDKESNTIGIIYDEGDKLLILSFDTRESLIEFQVKLHCTGIYDGVSFRLLLRTSPNKSKIQQGTVRIHIQNYKFCLTSGNPPKLENVWEISKLRRYGVIENTPKFCLEGGTQCNARGQGIFVFLTDAGCEITKILNLASHGKFKKQKITSNLQQSTSSSFSQLNNIYHQKKKSLVILPKSFSSFSIPRKTTKSIETSNQSTNDCVMSRSWTMTSTQFQCNLETESNCSNYDKPKTIVRSIAEENYDIPKKIPLTDSGYQSLNVSQECEYCDSNSKNCKLCRRNDNNYENLKYLKQSTSSPPISQKLFESKTLGRIERKKNTLKFFKRSTSADLLEEIQDECCNLNSVQRSIDELSNEFGKTKMNDYVEMENTFLHKIKFKF